MSIALKNVCRTCLMESDDVKSLYDSCSTDIEEHVAEILMSITPLRFDSCDGFPTSICYGCIKEMLQFYKFVQKCCESDKRLRSHSVKIIQGTADMISIGNITIIDDHTNCLTYENNERNCNTQSLQCPLTEGAIKNELEQEMDIIEHKIDVKAEPNTCRETVERINSTEENTGVANLYKSLSPLKQHSKEQDGQDNDKQFETESLPVKRIHTKEKPYKCTHCKRSFSYKKSLSTHMRIHTHDKPFTCWVCNEEFAHSINLTRHIRTHTGEKPYKCTMCEHSFSVKNTLTTHMRIHTHEKPFTCSVCSQKFAHKCSLTNHIRIHTGEKPYECAICKRSFTRKERLISHKCIHMPEKPFSCAVCNLKFAQMISLTLHIRIHT